MNRFDIRFPLACVLRLVRSWVCLLLICTLALAGGTQAALAMSAGCAQINSTFGSGRTFSAGNEEYLDNLVMAAGDRISYDVTSSGSTNAYPADQYSGGGFAIYNTNDHNTYDVDLEEYTGSGHELTLHSNVTVPASPANYYIVYAWSNLSGATVNATVTCTPALPTVTSISPTSGPTTGGSTVIITGSHFTGTSAVTFGGVAASFIVNSDTQISATAPAGSGTVDVRVATADGTSTASTADQYTFVARPTVTSLSQASGPAGGGTSVIVSGSGFSGASSVRFGGTNVSFTINSDTQITATSPAGTGTVDVTVTSAGGTSATSAGDQFTFVSPPTLTTLSPNSGPTAGGTTVVLTGTGLSGASAVRFGATAASSFTVNSNTQITATSPAGTAGTVDITVVTPGGTSGTTSSDQFTYVAAPSVTAISPTSGPSAGGTTVVVTGTGFSAATAVTFGGTSALGYTVNGNSQITATAPAGVGTVDIRVTTAGGTSATIASDQFTYFGAPTITAISPTSGPTSGGTSVTITGTNFTSASAIRFGATAASGVIVVNSSTITATSPASSAGVVDVTVTGPGGTSATSSADRFVYVATPVASSFTGSSAAYNSGAATATSIDVSGHATNSPTSYAVGSATTAQGGSVSVNSSGMASYTPPSGFRGNDSFTFTATNAGGTSAPATVTVPVNSPTLSIALTGSGTQGTPLDGVAVSVSGGRAPYSCQSSGILPTGVVVNANCSLSGTPTVSGTYNITVDVTDSSLGTGPFTQSSGALPFTIAAGTPVISSISPSASALAGGTTVTLSGSNLGGVTQITFGSAAISVFSSQTSTQLQFPAPAAAAAGVSGGGAVTITATGPGGTSTGVAFAYVGPPVVSAIGSPTNNNTPAISGSALPGATVTLSISGPSPLTTSAITANGGGNWSFTPSARSDGAYTISATQTLDGVTSGTSNTVPLVIDATAPNAPTVVSPTEGADTGANVTLSGSVNEAGAAVEVSLDGGAFTPASVAGSDWNLALSGLATGSHSATVRAKDGLGNISGTTVRTFTVVGIPVAGNMSASAAFETPTPITLTPAIGGGAHTSISVATGPAHGTISVAGDVVTYTPAAGYFGSDSFTYSATGPGGTSPVATVSITIVPPGAPTVTGKSGVSVAFGSTGTAIDLSGSVSGIHSSIAIATAAAHGTTSIAGNVVTYTPATGYFGADSFTFTATGPGGTSAPATVGLTVATPAAPTVASVTGIAVPYNAAGTAIDLAAHVTGVHTSIAFISAPAHGSAVVAGDVVTYTPAADYYGADSFTFAAVGPGGTSTAATVSLIVATPGAPTASNIADVAVAYNDAGTAIDLTATIAGVHSGVSIASAPSHGTTSVAGDVVTYTPAAGYFGSDSFTYVATGPGGTSPAATVGLTVAPPPPPVAKPGSSTAASSAQAGSSAVINLSALVDGAYSSIQIATQPAHGAVTLNNAVQAQGLVRAASITTATYVPNAGFSGTDSFTFVATGPGGQSAPAKVTITVVGKVPTAQPKTATATDNQKITVDLTEGASDGPFTSAAIVNITPQDKATAQIVAGGTADARTYSLEVTPAARFGGTVVVTYTLSNQFGTSDPATVTVAVTARPDPSQDPTVRALSDAQTESVRRFAQSQSRNFLQRAEQLHNGGGSGRGSMDMALNAMDSMQYRQPDPLGEQASADLAARMRGEPVVTTGPTGRMPSAMPQTRNAAPGKDDGDGKRRIGSVAIWSGGIIDIGTRDRTTDRAKISATSSGLSAGADIKLAEALTVGVGGGAGFENTTIAQGAAHLHGESNVVATYASFAPTSGTFIDGVFGWGDLSYRTRRSIDSATALGSRNGNMWFGAASAGVDRTSGQLRWSAYGRAEWLDGSLDAYVENGAGMMNLRYDARDVRSLSGVFGGKIELDQRFEFGSFRPRLRGEWSHEFQDSSVQMLDYADIPGEAFYGISTQGWTRDQYEVSVGAGLYLPKRWTFDFEFGVRAASGERAGRIAAKVSKQF